MLQRGTRRHPPVLLTPALLLLLLAPASALAETAPIEWTGTSDLCASVDSVLFDGEMANESVHWQVSLGPRVTNSNASAEFRKGASENLSAWGWDVREDPHPRQLAEDVNMVTNLIADLPAIVAGEKQQLGSGPRVILAAHYDSRQMADRDLNESLWDQPIPGANDGASGAAVLLELARHLPAHQLGIEVTLLFTDGEDWGPSAPLLGAFGWANNLSQEGADRTRAFILLDMVGDADLEIGFERNSNGILYGQLELAAAALGDHAEWDDCSGQVGLDGAVRNVPLHSVWDDHWAVREWLIPAVDLIDFSYGPTGANPGGGWWHTTEDTPDKVSAESLAVVGRMVELSLLAGLGEEPLPGDLRVQVDDGPDDETEPEPVASVSSSPPRAEVLSLSVWLGIPLTLLILFLWTSGNPGSASRRRIHNPPATRAHVEDDR